MSKDELAKDFTLKIYQQHILALMSHGRPFVRFDDYMASEATPDCILLRHDVDRKPLNSLAMARLEAKFDAKATYYFRARRHTFKPDIIKEIRDLGHEIGYHYECLSDHNGDMAKALDDFKENLDRFRKHAEVKTISMHGSPLKPYDNRDMWRNVDNMRFLKNELDILGEVYLDIDYSDIAYISDTGRNWVTGKSNRRDSVDSNIAVEFDSRITLHSYFQKELHNTMVFQIHPERWTDSQGEWLVQFAKDYVINAAKLVVKEVF